jgi:hypothetical protein
MSLDLDQAREASRLREAGKSYRQVGEVLGISKGKAQHLVGEVALMLFAIGRRSAGRRPPRAGGRGSRFP